MDNQATSPSRIPAFASLEEAAAFWDTHDSGDYESEFAPIAVEIAKDVSSMRLVTFEIDDEAADRLTELARRQGLRRSDLARTWVLNELARELSRTADAALRGIRHVG